MKLLSIATLVMLSVQAHSDGGEEQSARIATVHKNMVSIDLDGARMNIAPDGFRFEILNSAGAIVAPMHAVSGLKLDGSPVDITNTVALKQGELSVISKKGLKAKVFIGVEHGVISVKIAPEKDKTYSANLSLGGMQVAYGLGDAGGWSGRLNLVSDKKNQFELVNNGSRQRWQSSFVVCPKNKFAGVVFQGRTKSVTLGPKEYSMTVSSNKPATFHYLTGDMPTIYQNYRDLLTAKGYPNIKPKFRLFELGWESWAALGYQTNAETVLKSLKDFQDNGYPIRWAIVGSGFWENGGTTTSFGEFGEKFPDPRTFKTSLNNMDVKWMIGLRTNFVLPGGPYIPKTKKRDANFKGNSFNGNPLSTEGIDKNYFIKDSSGKNIVKSSKYFPTDTIPCHLLNGHNPAAVAWYAKLYKEWNVDGVKEDTMMNLGSEWIGIFDQPISRLANENALVMARCGSFSSAGTLTRINDTHLRALASRIPVNYLQYAASGAPNVYSDTVGFHGMKHYSELPIRHAWLLSLTAGMAVGEHPFKWTVEQQENFKKSVDFHYQIGPYLYDAALKSHQTGFPYTMTPLGIAYTEDKNCAEPPHYQWMAGESILCAPLVKRYKSGKMDLYLPEGTWFDYDTGKQYQGPKMLKNFAMPVSKTPCFIGGKGILVLRSADDASLRMHIYPVSKLTETFTFNHPVGGGTTKLILRKGRSIGVWDGKTGKKVAFDVSKKNKSLSFIIEQGKTYEYTLNEIK